MLAKRRLIGAIALALLAIALPSLPLQAQTAAQRSWPQRPVKFILTLGPGSGADIGARLIAEKLTARWGHPVVVENRPGGDGFVAINAFIGARDNHVLLFGPASSFTAHPYLHEKLPYDPRDLAPVTRISSTLMTINVPPTLKANSLQELFALARARPGKLNWATVTGATDLVLAAFLKSSAIDMAKIPYRDTVHALNDVAEDRLQLYWAALAIVRGAIQAGRVKPLAITASETTSIMPNMPTVAEAGLPALTFDGLVGIYGTRDMPNELRERVAADVKAVLTDPAIVSRLQATGQVVVPGSAAEFAASIDKQRTTVAGLAKVLGIKAAR
jgi:tripartite-type tricarboxylate transporter receptor subunit TctC